MNTTVVLLLVGMFTAGTPISEATPAHEEQTQLPIARQRVVTPPAVITSIETHLGEAIDEATPGQASDLDPVANLPYQGRVTSVADSGLRARTGPGRQFPAELILREGALIQVFDRSGPDLDGATWFLVGSVPGGEPLGWSNAAFISSDVDDEQPGPPHLDLELPIVQARVLTMKITAYSYQEPTGGAHGWITKSGTTVRWGVVAVDPSIIPLGSKLAIDGFPGQFLAEDTGFGVRGMHVDVFFADESAAVRFGVQYRDVIVLL